MPVVITLTPQGRFPAFDMSFSFRQAAAATRSSKGDNLFAGRSTLRADEKKKEEGPPKDSALQAYLAKNYSIGDKDGAGAGKRKKKQKSGLDAVGASRIVDQDVSGFNALDPKGRGTLTKRRANTGDDDDEEEEGKSPRRWWGCGAPCLPSPTIPSRPCTPLAPT